MTKFLIIVTGWNCHQYAEKCFNSLIQNYPSDIALINDGSVDGTEQVLRKIKSENHHKENIKVYNYEKNEGAARRRYEVIHEINPDPEMVIILVGMDDELNPKSLQRIAFEYEDPQILMTYGNWSNQHGITNPMTLYFSDEVHQNRLYRKQVYRSTAPNTFKAKLFYQLTEDDFKMDGEWLMNCTETNLMISCLEMCGKDRIGIIPEPIYFYRQGLHNGTIARYGGTNKQLTANRVKELPIKDLI